MFVLILFKLSSSRDKNLILSECSLGGVDKKGLEQIFKDATKEKFGFIKIDLETPIENRKFSKNWNDYYKIEDSVTMEDIKAKFKIEDKKKVK